jgi:hypothetical protein
MVLFCDNCGAENADKAKFCVNCGNDLKVAPSQQTGSQEPQYIPQMEPQAEGTNCLWCRQTAGFKEEEGKLDSKWGVTAHKFKLFICNNCGYTHLFGLGRTIFDFD